MASTSNGHGSNGTNTSRSTSPSALITGGASGMGLSVATHLVSQGWNVCIVDFNETSGQEVAERLGKQAQGQDHVQFVKVDVTDYEQQAKAFVETWARWGRLDFVFANAGFGDKQDFYAQAEERADGSPAKPNISVIDVCLLGVVYSAFLALHYFRKNDGKKGKLVSTSSLCGLYPGEGIPLYTAAKHGVVGLTRAMARKLAQSGESITVNCICPGDPMWLSGNLLLINALREGLVDTGLTPVLMAVSPPEYVTPHTTIVKAVTSFLDDDSKNGLAAECSGENVHYRVQQEFGDDKAEWIMTTSFERLWAKRKEEEEGKGK
ncbi:hypothetical protein H2198_009433 [Neophaeococcomyces mojaviensis]|uniref:Uncharacterized protein n=1 Tax=Neophaeococcomyces mojaviensis TaxID=3383035 RepID=A0ACC2ZUH7_9EURO|nr:hypothetical protein H2198_009433 [Knufia sp. JES_112]